MTATTPARRRNRPGDDQNAGAPPRADATPREVLREQRRAAHFEERDRPPTVDDAEAYAADTRRSLRVRLRWALIADGLRNDTIDPARAVRLLGDDVDLTAVAPVLAGTVARLQRTGLIRGSRLTDRGRQA